MSVVFVLTAALTIAGAVAASVLRNLVHCALSLTITFAGLALLYLELGAQFAGFAQMLVYIGAVAILVVFAILLTRGAGTPEYGSWAKGWFGGIVLAAAVFALLGWAVVTSLPAGSAVAEPSITVQQIGAALMTTYVLPLEIVAVLLTVALIGAVIVAMAEAKGPKVERAGEQ
ncbi:MAG TPA: NADH-quinone oxidoreductase subunit J [Acidobacteriaceae bacterium]